MSKQCSSVAFASLPADDENTAAMRWQQSLYNKATGKKSSIVDISQVKIKRYSSGCTKARWTVNNKEIDCLVNLYPKEWLSAEMTQDDLNTFDLSQLKTFEPWWKLIMANKAMLPLLYEMYPDHESLLPAYFDWDHAKSKGLAY